MSSGPDFEITISSEQNIKKKAAHLLMRCLAVLYRQKIDKRKVLRNC